MANQEAMEKGWRQYTSGFYDLDEKRAFYAGYQAALPQWISVDERLPETGVDMLTLHAGGIGISFYSRNAWWTSAQYHIGKELPVTHWMPLPEPPND